MSNVRFYLSIAWIVLCFLFFILFAGLFVIYCPIWAVLGFGAFLCLQIIGATLKGLHKRQDEEMVRAEEGEI